MVFRIKKRLENLLHSIKNISKICIFNQDGEVLLEYGLLIGLAIIIFLVLITTVDNIYNWVDENLNKVLDFSG